MFLYMTLTMLIMTALPSQDQITLSLHIRHKKQLWQDRNNIVENEEADPPEEKRLESTVN